MAEKTLPTPEEVAQMDDDELAKLNAELGEPPQKKAQEPEAPQEPESEPGPEPEPEAEPANDDGKAESGEAKPGNDPEMAKRRIKAERDAEKRAQEIAAQMLEQRQAEQAAQAPRSPAEPNKETDPAAWAEWRARQIVEAEIGPYKPYLEKAAQEQHMTAMEHGFTQLERAFLAQEDVDPKEYNEVVKQMGLAVVRGLMAQYPTMTQAQAVQAMKAQMLQAADTYYRAGHNPAQALYERGLSIGFGPQQAAPQAQSAPQVASPPVTPRPSLSVIAKNKKAASSPIAAGGGTPSVGDLTLEAIDQMSAEELAAIDLTPMQVAQGKRLIA